MLIILLDKINNDLCDKGSNFRVILASLNGKIRIYAVSLVENCTIEYGIKTEKEAEKFLKAFSDGVRIVALS